MINRLLQLGIHPALSFPQQNKIRVFNTACCVVFAISLFYFVFSLIFGFYLATAVTVCSMLFLSLALCLMQARRYSLAFHFMLCYAFLLLSAFTFLFGTYSRSYYYFLFLPVASTILFDRRNVSVYYLLLSGVVLLINVTAGEHRTPYYDNPNLQYFGYPNLGFALLLIFLGVSRFKRENLGYSQQVEEQRFALEEKNKEMTDSINYAQRIQYALLAHAKQLGEHLPEHFVLFKPKDIVSGDFYWAAHKNGLFYLAVCDSTGHGVPGAFMSLLNLSFLNEAVNEKGLTGPALILNHVRQRLIATISQGGARDGMDAILICYDRENQHLTYSAANNAPLLVRGGQISSLPKDKMPVGQGEKQESFASHAISLQPGDSLYLLTDGYADQFGGPRGKKFKAKQLEEVLLSVHEQPVQVQESRLHNAFLSWKGSLEQVDDVCIVGIRF